MMKSSFAGKKYPSPAATICWVQGTRFKAYDDYSVEIAIHGTPRTYRDIKGVGDRGGDITDDQERPFRGDGTTLVRTSGP